MQIKQSIRCILIVFLVLSSKFLLSAGNDLMFSVQIDASSITWSQFLKLKQLIKAVRLQAYGYRLITIKACITDCSVHTIEQWYRAEQQYQYIKGHLVEAYDLLLEQFKVLSIKEKQEFFVKFKTLWDELFALYDGSTSLTITDEQEAEIMTVFQEEKQCIIMQHPNITKQLFLYSELCQKKVLPVVSAVISEGSGVTCGSNKKNEICRLFGFFSIFFILLWYLSKNISSGAI